MQDSSNLATALKKNLDSKQLSDDNLGQKEEVHEFGDIFVH